MTGAPLLALVAALAPAEPAAPPDWVGLDREVARLARSRAAEEPEGPRFTMQFQSVLRGGGGRVYAGDLGAEIEQLKLGVRGTAGRFEYKLRTQNKRGTSELSTVWVRTPVAPRTRLSVGHEKVAFLWSSLVSRSRVLFSERSRQGGTWNARDFGARLLGEVGRARWTASVQNGGDGVVQDLLWSARLEATVLGEGAVRSEGSPGPEAPRRLQLGAGFVDEGTLDDGSAWAVDAAFVCGPLFAHAEWVDYGSGFTAGSVTTGGGRKAAGSADTNPVDVTLGWRFDERWEAAARVEWVDDAAETWAVLAGVNRHFPERLIKLQLDATHQGSNDPAQRGDRVTLGFFFNLG